MNKIVFCLLVIFSSVIAQEIGQWENFTDMKQSAKIAVKENLIWVATSGGAYNFGTQDITNRLTKSEGLSSQILTAVEIDRFGKVWFGTSNGILNIYNPETQTIKKIFDINRTENTQKQINDILILDDIAYVSIDFGLSLIDINSLEFKESVLKFGDIPSATRVNSVFVDDIIYVSHENGFAVQKANSTNLANPDSWITYIVRSGTDQIPADEVNSSIIFNNEIIIAANNGVYKFNGSGWQRALSLQNNVIDLKIIGTNLYALTQNSLIRFDGAAETVITQSSSNLTYTDLAVASDGVIYIATSSGMLEINAGTITPIIPSGPETNNFLSVTVDANSNVWAATGKNGFGKGLMKLQNKGWQNYNLANNQSINTDQYHKVFTFEDYIFACSWGSGFTKILDDKIEIFDFYTVGLSGITSDPDFVVIQDIKQDAFNNNFWVFDHLAADGKPLIMFSNDGTKYSFQFPFFNLTLDNFIDNGEVDDNNTKWMSIQGRGLFYFNENGTLDNTNDDTWGRMNQSEFFENRDITSLAVDKRNELWVGTSLGIKIIPDPSRPKSQLLSSFPLRQQSINTIAVDALNRKWVGTSQGLFYVSSDGSSLINQYDSKNSPLPTDDILSVAIDDVTGIVYVGTSLGLSALQTSAVKPNEDFSDLRAYPNPFLVGGSNSNRLQIDGLIQQSTIKILSINGKLVKEFESVGGRIDSWDGRDESGQYVSTGIYLIVAFDEEANKVETAKVAVIKE